MPTLTGTAMNTAIADTTTVPNANARVPNVCDCGSQTSPVKYDSPCEVNAGQALTIIVTAMSARTTRTSAPDTNATARKTRSNVRPGGRAVLSGRGSMATVMRRKRDRRWVARSRTTAPRHPGTDLGADLV